MTDQKSNAVADRPFPTPPPGFNALKAKPEELDRYGICRAPDERREPRSFAFWRRMFESGPAFAPTQGRAQPIPSARPASPASDIIEQRVRKLSKSPNWSGIVVKPPRCHRIAQIMGRWTIPRVSPPEVSPADVVLDEGYHSSIWIGINGRGRSPGSSLPQIGTRQIAQAGGKEAGPHEAWWQWWVKGSGATQGATSIKGEPEGFPVQPGDEIQAVLAITGANSAIGILKNVHKNRCQIVGLYSPAPLDPLGLTAEWIVERPTKTGDYLMYPLPNFGEVSFQDCLTRSAPSLGEPTIEHDLRNGGLIRMCQVYEEPCRIALVSTPEEPGPRDPTAFRVRYSFA
jgi:hypothetical protein